MNETLVKILCHNIVVLIHEIYELGIAPMFLSPDAIESREISIHLPKQVVMEWV